MSPARPSRLGLRGRLLLSVLGAIAVVLAALTVGFNLLLAGRLDDEAKGVAQARASAELAALRIQHGRIQLPEAPDELSPDSQIWVFQGSRPIEQPRAVQANSSAASTLALRAPATRDVRETSTRLLSVPVAQSGRRLGAVVAGVSLAAYAETRHTALVASTILALAILIAVGLAARWLIGRALRPVARMTRQANDWSERDLDRRFALGPPRDELTQLANTLDELLDRLAASLRHERRLSAEISHELRTPLANITAEAQYALRHGRHDDEGKASLEHILQSSRQLGRVLDTLMAAARAQLEPNRATSDAATCANEAVKVSVAQDLSSQLEITVDSAPEHVRIAVERDLVERILAPLLENASRYARHSVRVTIERDRDAVLFVVDDDGPGVPVEEREAIFQPGYRTTSSAATTTMTAPGAGLGLALCRRLARSAGGEVLVDPGEAGARFIVRLPAA